MFDKGIASMIKHLTTVTVLHKGSLFFVFVFLSSPAIFSVKQANDVASFDVT